MGRLADCDIAFSHAIVVHEIFSGNQKSILDHKPFPIEISDLMHH